MWQKSAALISFLRTNSPTTRLLGTTTIPASSFACSTSASKWRTGRATRSARRPRKRPASCAAAPSHYIEFGGIFNDRMDIRFDPGGTVTVFGGTHSHGQGHATVFAQLVHEFLGVPFDQIRYVQGDTAQVQFGRGTYGARSAVVRGSALRRAADAIIDKAKSMAAAMLEADAGDIEFKDGNLKVVGTDKTIPLVEVAKASFAPMGPMTGIRHRARRFR